MSAWRPRRRASSRAAGDRERAHDRRPAQALDHLARKLPQDMRVAEVVRDRGARLLADDVWRRVEDRDPERRDLQREHRVAREQQVAHEPGQHPEQREPADDHGIAQEAPARALAGRAPARGEQPRGEPEHDDHRHRADAVPLRAGRDPQPEPARTRSERRPLRAWRRRNSRPQANIVHMSESGRARGIVAMPDDRQRHERDGRERRGRMGRAQLAGDRVDGDRGRDEEERDRQADEEVVVPRQHGAEQDEIAVVRVVAVREQWHELIDLPHRVVLDPATDVRQMERERIDADELVARPAPEVREGRDARNRARQHGQRPRGPAARRVRGPRVVESGAGAGAVAGLTSAARPTAISEAAITVPRVRIASMSGTRWTAIRMLVPTTMLASASSSRSRWMRRRRTTSAVAAITAASMTANSAAPTRKSCRGMGARRLVVAEAHEMVHPSSDAISAPARRIVTL